jgi:NAD-dependent dihydropyrimidine dehydrogenase PreA subunit
MEVKMSNILLIYFSGTGITRHYASLIKDEFIKRGDRCDVIDLEEMTDLPTLWQKKPVALNYTINAEIKRPLSKYPWPYQDLKRALRSAWENPLFSSLPNDWEKYDLIGFGSPVYAFRPAPVMIRFLLDLPFFSSQTRAFSFATHDGAQGDYELFMKNVLDRKGFTYIGHLDQSFIYSAGVVMRKKCNHVKAGHLLARKSSQAVITINDFIDYVNSLDSDRSYKYPGPGTLSKLAGLPYRLIYSYGIDFLLNHFLFGYGINKNDCILCMTCVNQCPQGLIELDDDGYPIRLYHCMYCLRCLNWCPTGALYFSPITKDKARFPGLEVLEEAVSQQDHEYKSSRK